MINKLIGELRILTGYVDNNSEAIFNRPSRVELERAELRAELDPWPSYQQTQWEDADFFEKIRSGYKEEFEFAQRIRLLIQSLKNEPRIREN